MVVILNNPVEKRRDFKKSIIVRSRFCQPVGRLLFCVVHGLLRTRVLEPDTARTIMAHPGSYLKRFGKFGTGRVAVFASMIAVLLTSLLISSLDLITGRASLDLSFTQARPTTSRVSTSSDKKTLVICMSICGTNGPEALISVKSALLHKSEQHKYEFHFFTDESEGLKTEFIDYMLKIGQGNSMENVAMKFHPIENTKMMHLFKLCATNRLLMPKELSSTTDEYIYVDTDTLWLEDPANLMQEFSRFTSDQEIGLAYEIETSEKEGWYHSTPQGNRTFVGPTGLNSGVGIYKIRDKMTMLVAFEKIIQENEGNLPLGDQDVLNEYLAHRPLKFYKLACQWNRRTDSKCVLGIRGILHGNRGVFHGALEANDEYVLQWNLVKALPFDGFPTVQISKKREETLGLALEHLLDSRELDTMFQAASVVAASSVEKEKKGEIFKEMGHIADVEEQVNAYGLLARRTEISRICEIGFNAGHSALLFLNSDETNKLTSFDSALPWSPISSNFVSFLFPNRFTYITGNSAESVAENLLHELNQTNAVTCFT